MRRHPAYAAWIILLCALLALGLGLLIYGSTRQGPLPRPVVTVPHQVQYG